MLTKSAGAVAGARELVKTYDLDTVERAVGTLMKEEREARIREDYEYRQAYPEDLAALAGLPREALETFPRGFDHTSAIVVSRQKRDDGEVVAIRTEPYQVDMIDLASIGTFCIEYGLEFFIHGKGAYFPGSAICIELRKKGAMLWE